MSAAAKLSLLAALVLGLSLGPKILVESHRGVSDDARLAAEIAAMLTAQGYALEPVAVAGYPAFIGASGPCRIVTGTIAPQGYQKDRFAQWAEPVGPLRYFHNGNWYTDVPRFRPVVESRVARIAHAFGLRMQTTPVIAVATNRGCDVTGLDWSALRMQTRDPSADQSFSISSGTTL